VATIVLGVEDSFRADDAVALAGDLAGAAEAEVLAVSAYLFDDDPAAHYNLAIRASLRQTTERVLDRACQPLSQLRVHRVAVADPSPARALIRAATDAGATLIVIGSTHSEFTGRLRPGTTAWRLLQGAPCAVALAPQGYRMRPHLTFNRVTAAFDGSAGGYAALSTASRIARATGQTLRVVSVFAPDALAPPWLHVSPGFLRVSPDAEQAARTALERAVADHPGAQPAFLVGDPGRELARESEVCDLLVVGSRGYGPEGVLVLGGVSDRVMQTAACPALIVPNGVETPLAELFPAYGKLRIDSTDAPGSGAPRLPVAS
jgi:nucleotide-binding universal stress UspA family protein